MISRRELLRCSAAVTGAVALPRSLAAKPQARFVSSSRRGFHVQGQPYRYVGTNMWYGAYLGSILGAGGPPRLRRELDRLAGMGVRNVRVLGASEKSPLIGSVTPTFHNRTGGINEELARGLDLLLAEFGKRNMRAVIYLNNFWEWSGGMMTYASWFNGGNYINANDPKHPWPAFADRAAEFYALPKAVGAYHAYVRALVGRTNSVTGQRYVDDPAIMAWQLANEPRPGASAATLHRTMPLFQRWIRSTARIIKEIDPNHLVSTGSEGLMGCVRSEACVTESASSADIDYLTMHIWPQNFGWIDPADLGGTQAAGEQKTAEYIAVHVAMAKRIGKPLVIEEFGYPRDNGGYLPGSPTTYRDRYYEKVMAAVAQEPTLAGLNFWAWNGEGRAQHADHRFQAGDTAFLGDPPHEPQGWYGVFDQDEGTIGIVTKYSRMLER